MNRQELLSVLKKVEPAVGSKDAIAVLACLCFGKTEVHGYDDTIALSFPLQSPFRGGVRGKLLLAWLGISRAKEIELAQDGEIVKVKAGRAKLDLPLLPTSSFIFKEPDLTKSREIVISDKFMDALKMASISMSNDPSIPWGLGVTMVYGDAGTTLYSTNDKTITRVVLGEQDIGRSMILPPRFVELLLDIGRKDQPMSLNVTKTWVIAKFQSGLKLFSRSIDECNPKEYRDIMEPSDDTETKIAIPTGFPRCIERAMTVINYAKRSYTIITAKDDKLRFRTLSEAGEVSDLLNFEGHPAIEIKVPPDLLCSGLSKAKHISLLRGCIRLTAGKSFTHLVCTIGK